MGGPGRRPEPAPAHRPLGFLNPYLYSVGALHTGFHDVTVGNNADLETTVPGYDAVRLGSRDGLGIAGRRAACCAGLRLSGSAGGRSKR